MSGCCQIAEGREPPLKSRTEPEHLGDVGGARGAYPWSMTIAAQISDDLANLVTAHGDSVVRVESSGCRGGSGIAWTEDLVITSAHLVEGDSKLGLPDGTTADGKLIGRDPGTDVAVLRVDGKLRAAPFALLDQTKVGHLTISLARPGKTVRAALGMIGALGDEFRTRSGGRIDRYVQVDGGAPRGFTGSLLLDARGRALGMNNHGLAIPTVTLKRVVDELVAHGRIRRGYLGVGVAPVRLPNGGAVVVVAIEPGGPAEKGGLLVGDIIVSIDGTTIEGPRQLAVFLTDKIDQALKVSIQRGGVASDLTVTSGTRA
jgi:S1-C subfamily serine protease